jgi:Lrp/AsnC family leucine-responsive transcriptional regulator
MEKISEIDKKIIYELGKNSRQSYKQIAKNIKSKKEVVAYHINELLEKGIIDKFVPVFSLTRLGIFSNKIYLRLGGLSKNAEEKIVSSLVRDKNVAWIARAVGRWDLLLGFYSKNIIEFSKIKEAVLSKISNYIEEYQTSFIEDGFVFNRDYLLENKNSRRELIYGGQLKFEKIDELDYKIISLIKNNARIEMIELSEKLFVDPRTIIARIKSLQERGILQGYAVFLNLNKIGFQLYKLCISLKNYEKSLIESFLDYCKKNPNTIHVIKCIGSWEVELEIESDNLNQVYGYIKELKNNFPSMIKEIELVTIIEEPKLEFFPEKNL